MPTVKGIVAHYDLLPSGSRPFYQPQPPSKTISIPAFRKVSAPTIIDADTVILDPQASDWVMVEPARAPQPTHSMQNNDRQGKANDPAPFFWRRALTAYAHQMPAYTPFLSTGVQVNLVA